MHKKFFAATLLFLALPVLAFSQIPQAGVSAGAAFSANGTSQYYYSTELSYTLLLGNFLLSNRPLTMLTLNLGARFTVNCPLEETRFLAELIWFQGLCAGAGLTAGVHGGSFNLVLGGIVPVFPWAVLVLFIRPIWEADGTYLTELGMRFKLVLLPFGD